MNELHVTLRPEDWETDELNPDPDGFCPIVTAISRSLEDMRFRGVRVDVGGRSPIFWLTREATGEERGPFDLCPGLAAHWRHRWVKRKTSMVGDGDAAWQAIPRAVVEAWPEFGAWHDQVAKENEVKAAAVRARELRMQAFRNLASPGREPGPRAIAFARWLQELWLTNRNHGFRLAEAFASPADAHRVLDGAELAGWLQVWSWSPNAQQRATHSDAELEARDLNECCIWEVACCGNGRCEHVREFLEAMREHLDGDVPSSCIECQWAAEMDKAEAKLAEKEKPAAPPPEETFWDGVERVAAEARKLPDWAKGGINLSENFEQPARKKP